MQCKNVEYGGWKNCLQLGNGRVELVITLDVGPRILKYALSGGPNVFKNYPEMMGVTGGDKWMIFGGHRLWHAPEDAWRTYAPDFDPVAHDWDGKTLKLRPPAEERTGLRKEIHIEVVSDSSQVRVAHLIHNESALAVEFAPWALSVMDAGARAIVPREPYVPHGEGEGESLLPGCPLALWKFTDLADPRWTFGTRYLQLHQRSDCVSPQKMGVFNSLGWAACAVHDQLFVLRYPVLGDLPHADFGSNTEIFTNGDMLEMETLGPLLSVPPGESLSHVEHWGLFDQKVGESEDEIDAAVLPCVEQVDAL